MMGPHYVDLMGPGAVWTSGPCEHCYCQPSEYVGSREHPVKHITCCRCKHVIAERFLPTSMR